MMSDFFKWSTTIHSLAWMSSCWSCHRWCICSTDCLNWTKSWSQVVSSSNQVKLSSFPTIQCIIWCTIIVKVKVSLNPLKHLKIILILCFHQFSRLKIRITCEYAYINISGDPRLLKSILQNLIIGGILIVMLSQPVDFTNLNCIGMNGVYDLAIHSPCCALFNLLHV